MRTVIRSTDKNHNNKNTEIWTVIKNTDKE